MIMASSPIITVQKCFMRKITKEEEEEIERTYTRYREIISTLPKEKGLMTTSVDLSLYQDFWFKPMFNLEGVMWVQQNFKPRPTDCLLVSIPKSGTTWFRSLMFSIVNRTKFDFTTHPLISHTPGELVPVMELHLFRKPPIGNPEVLSSPRVLATHIPYTMLSEPILNSGCRIVYVCRNPKDVFVSLWHFLPKIMGSETPEVSLEEAFDLFCSGRAVYGPFWNHVLGYWKASLESPDKVLFLKYEDMIENPLVHAKKMAEFLGYPFTLEEEEDGVVQQVLNLCSFEKMHNLEVNKYGINRDGIKNVAFFRKGKPGDWKNHLTPEMIEHIDKIVKEKFDGTGLTF